MTKECDICGLTSDVDRRVQAIAVIESEPRCSCGGSIHIHAKCWCSGCLGTYTVKLPWSGQCPKCGGSEVVTEFTYSV